MKFQSFAGKYGKVKFDGKVRSPISEGYHVRQTQRIESLGTIDGNATLKGKQQYTGDKMIGVSIIHKSCLQPVFSENEAKEVASMRR